MERSEAGGVNDNEQHWLYFVCSSHPCGAAAFILFVYFVFKVFDCSRLRLPDLC